VGVDMGPNMDSAQNHTRVSTSNIFSFRSSSFMLSKCNSHYRVAHSSKRCIFKLFNRELLMQEPIEREHSAEIFKQSMGARNRVGIGLSYRPARLHSLAELAPRN
jgi:hypothetical protein